VYWGFLNDVSFLEMSSGYRIKLATKMNLVPFGGISLYSLGFQLNEDNSYVCFAGGLNLEFILHEHWTLNLRASGSLPFSHLAGDSGNLFTDALLYLVIGTGYTL
jgi:hypothetical protein